MKGSTLSNMNVAIDEERQISAPSDHDGAPNENEVADIGGKETRVLRFMKSLVVCTMIVAAAILAPLSYRFAREHDDELFEEQYEHLAAEVIDSFEKHATKAIWAAAELSVRYTKMSGRQFGAGRKEYEFPYISLFGFELGAFSAIRESEAAISAFSYAPILQAANRSDWEEFQASQIETAVGYDGLSGDIGWPNEKRTYRDGVYELDYVGEPVTSELRDGATSPIWQFYPEETRRRYKYFDAFSDSTRRVALQTLIEVKSVVFSGILNHETEQVLDEHLENETITRPRSLTLVPVLDRGNVVGSVSAETDWLGYFEATKRYEDQPVILVLENGKCGDVLSFVACKDSVQYLGIGDLHDTRFQEYERSSTPWKIQCRVMKSFKDKAVSFPREYSKLFEDTIKQYAEGPMPDDICPYIIRIYPTTYYRNEARTSTPKVISVSVVMMFVFAVFVFWVYDLVVERRQNIVMDSAVKSKAIVDSLFPSIVRDRLFRNQRKVTRQSSQFSLASVGANDDESGFLTKLSPKIHLTALLKNQSHRDALPLIDRQEPIAEVFQATTIMFADIAGFTAWSSEREPSQVFTLLETLYAGFDKIAKRLGAFKVETIGDCYVAVAGLPDPADDHAIIMANFASECLQTMHELTRELEVQLGPGTSDLQVRIGLHSGPVTAGVLRAEKSRFQLFGDSVNTTARMEAHGLPSRIHASQATADLITEAGKSHWLTSRLDQVHAKGKGMLQTYWIENVTLRPLTGCSEGLPGSRAEMSFRRESDVSQDWKDLTIGENIDPHLLVSKQERLIDWNTDVLYRLLAKVNAANYSTKKKRAKRGGLESSSTLLDDQSRHSDILGQVTEVMRLPEFNAAGPRDRNCAPVSSNVRAQLRRYVSMIASLYQDNPFHDFEHASHVALSANKLMKRIIAPEDFDYITEGQRKRKETLESDLHYSTFGISSDPLTQFCVVLGALVHDVDHPGVPNVTLVNENTQIAKRYGNKSVAEQHSVKLALERLEEDGLEELRSCIYTNEEQYSRFNQLIINIVLATDIVDKELQQLRKKRWDKAFHRKEDSLHATDKRTVMASDDINRKATIVIEYIIQASDVAHTMQHWHVFAKWNGKLFNEMYAAYLKGRSDKNPADGWYKSEIGFFDFYIIPLARKLKECGVFGVSSDEYLSYALENREEWIIKGEEIVASMLKTATEELGVRPPSDVEE